MTTKDGEMQSHPQIVSNDSSIDDDDECVVMYVSLKSKRFYWMLLFQFLYVIPLMSGIVVIPLFGAQWFGNCLVQDNIYVTVIPDCEPDYIEFNFYFTLFTSIGGILSFLFSAFIGRLSDSFGRKLFIILGILCWMIPRIVLVFYINFFVYWSLAILADITGGDSILPSLKASISDLLSPNDRVQAFGKLHGVLGLGFIVGAVSSIIISRIYDNYTVLVFTAICHVIVMLYALIFLKESIDLNNNRIKMTKNAWSNPFKPLFAICSNKFVRLMSLIHFCATLIESGVMGSLFAYLGHSLSLNDDGRAAMTFGAYVIIVSIVLVPISFLFLPFLKRKKVHYCHIITIAVSFRILSLIALILVSCQLGKMSEYLLYVSAALQGCGMFSFAVFEGIVSEYVTKDCRGTVFGVVNSYKGIAAILGPFSFGALFSKLSETNYSFMFIILGIIIALIEIGLALIPLKRLLNTLKPQSVCIGAKKIVQDDESDKEVELIEHSMSG